MEFFRIWRRKEEKMKSINKNYITITLAIIYFVILTWIIVFKMQFSFENLPKIRNINLVPFGESVIINGKVDFGEMIDNAIVFIPVGLYLCMLKKDWKLSKKIGIIAGISLTFEMLQFLFGIGATDITDIINNTLGGMLGLGIYQMFYRILKKEEKTNQVLNALGILATSMMIVFLAILIIVN